MNWLRTWRSDPDAVAIADRHYSRQTPGSPSFVAPGRCLIFILPDNTALWATSWPYAHLVGHKWPDAWNCSLFRNESSGILSSELIREAVAATRAVYGEPPPSGMITTVNAAKTRHKRDPGRCFRRAGFQEVGMTGSGLVVLQLMPDDCPPACLPLDKPGAAKHRSGLYR